MVGELLGSCCFWCAFWLGLVWVLGCVGCSDCFWGGGRVVVFLVGGY